MIGSGAVFFSGLDGYAATARISSATASGSVRKGEWSLSRWSVVPACADIASCAGIGMALVGERFALVEHEGRAVDEVGHAVGPGGRLGDDDAAVGVTHDDLVARGVVEHRAHGAGVVVEVAARGHARKVDRHHGEAVAG